MITIDDIGRAAATELRDAVLPELDSAAALARLDTPLQSTPDHRRRTPWRVVGLVAAAAAIIVAGVIVAVRHRDGRDKIINPVVTTTTTTAVGTTSSTEPTTTTTVAPTATALPVGRGSATVVPTPIPDTPLPRLVLPNPAMSPYQLQVGPCAACATTLFSAAKTVDPLEWTVVFLLPGHPLADGAIGIVTETKLGLLEQPGKVLDVSGHTYVTVQRAGLVAVVSGWNVARAELQRMADSLTGTGTDVGASVGYVPAGFVSAGAPTRPPSTLDGAWSVTYLGRAPDQPHQVTVGAFRTDRLETARSLVTTLGDGFSDGLVKKPYIVRGHDAVAIVSVSPPATISAIEWQQDDGVETYLDGSGNAESTMLGFAASLHPPTAEEWAALRATSTCTGPLRVTFDSATDTAGVATATFIVRNDGLDACPGGTLGYPSIEFRDEHYQIVRTQGVPLGSQAPGASFGGIPSHAEVPVQVQWSTVSTSRLEACPPVATLVITFSFAPSVRLPFDPLTTGVTMGPWETMR